MPRRYKKSKKTYRRSKNVFRRLTNAPLARKLPAKLIYEEEFTLDPGVGGLMNQKTFSANGLYDPDISGTGHQPRGFDQLIALYDHATVVGSKISCTFLNTDNTNSNTVGMLISDNTGVMSLSSDAIENPYSRVRSLSILGSGKEVSSLTLKCNPNKFLSIASPMSEDTVKNSSTNNPAEQVYYKVLAWQPQGTNSGIVECRVRIEYNVIFTEPIEPSQS